MSYERSTLVRPPNRVGRESLSEDSKRESVWKKERQWGEGKGGKLSTPAYLHLAPPSPGSSIWVSCLMAYIYHERAASNLALQSKRTTHVQKPTRTMLISVSQYHLSRLPIQLD